jgi:hypothetical protein
MTDGQLSSTPPAPSSSPRSTELPTPRPIDPPAGAPPSAVIAPAWAIPRWQAVLLLMGIATVFASNHIAARFAFNHGLNVGTAVVARSVGTAVFVALLIALLNVPLNLNAARLKRAALVGVLLTLQSVFLYSAVARMPVALALLAFNSFPILLALISWAGGQPAPHTRVAWAMAVALLGLILALDAPGVLAAISGRADANVRGLVGCDGDGGLYRHLGAADPAVLWRARICMASGCDRMACARHPHALLRHGVYHAVCGAAQARHGQQRGDHEFRAGGSARVGLLDFGADGKAHAALGRCCGDLRATRGGLKKIVLQANTRISPQP